MYPKEVTQRILALKVRGLSAREIVVTLRDDKEAPLKVSINTVYNHLHSHTAKDLIRERLRQQEKRITKMDLQNPELALKYTNELLKIELPYLLGDTSQTQNAEAKKESETDEELLRRYEDLFAETDAEANALKICSPQPLHSRDPQTDNQASSVSNT